MKPTFFLLLLLSFATSHEWFPVESVDSAIQWATDQIEAQRHGPPHCNTYRNGVTECSDIINLDLDTSALSLQDAFDLCKQISMMGPSGQPSMLGLSTAYPEGKAMSMFGPTRCSSLRGYEQQNHMWIN